MVDAYVGVDPGDKGAYCLLVPSTKQVAFKPTTDKPQVTLAWLHQIQSEFHLVVVQIEDVHSLHGMSAKSNFSFGGNVRQVNLIPQISGAPIAHVTPKVWQKHIGLKPIKTGTKNRTKLIKDNIAQICERLYPSVNIRGPRGGLHDGYSDALMIAHYASQTFKL